MIVTIGETAVAWNIIFKYFIQIIVASDSGRLLYNGSWEILSLISIYCNQIIEWDFITIVLVSAASPGGNEIVKGQNGGQHQGSWASGENHTIQTKRNKSCHIMSHAYVRMKLWMGKTAGWWKWRRGWQEVVPGKGKLSTLGYCLSKCFLWNTFLKRWLWTGFNLSKYVW